MDNKGIHCFITGRVQGVFFRANTQSKAIELGVTGWVRNLPDGRVEVLAFGSDNNLEQFQTWLKAGPQHAQVEGVEVKSVQWQSVVNFLVK